MTAPHVQCRYLRRNDQQCTAEAIDGRPDALIHLCAKHAGRVMELIEFKLKERRR
jgi:hypothetical protein